MAGALESLKRASVGGGVHSRVKFLSGVHLSRMWAERSERNLLLLTVIILQWE